MFQDLESFAGSLDLYGVIWSSWTGTGFDVHQYLHR